MRKTYQITCLSEAVSPITHMSGTAGNEAIIAREPVVTPDGIVYVPFLSGNALRHRCLREPGMLWLIERYGLRGRLNLTQLNFLLHGGNLTESNSHENTARIAECYRLFPLLRLVAGCLPNQILAGTVDAWRGMLVCEENRRHLPAELLPDERLKAAESFIGNWQYTRGDAGKLAIAAENSGDVAESSLMIFSGQCVTRGAVFLHGFTLRRVTEIELGAALLSLALWQAEGGAIGGQAARGHGRLSTRLYLPDVDQQQAIDCYVAHVDAVQDEAIAWLDACFTKAEKPKKGKKQRELIETAE